VKLIEVFCGSSSKGGCSSNTKMMGRLVSLALQTGVPTDEIIDQLESEICPTARYRAGRDEQFKRTGNSSCSKALASAIKKTLQAQKFFEDHQEELKRIFSAVTDLREKSVELGKERRDKAPCDKQSDWEYGCVNCGVLECQYDKKKSSVPIGHLDLEAEGFKHIIPDIPSKSEEKLSFQEIPLQEKRQEIIVTRKPISQGHGLVNIIGDEGLGEEYWIQKGKCPDCRAKIEHEGGCVSCRVCGFTKC
jgi:hypothetical protein